MRVLKKPTIALMIAALTLPSLSTATSYNDLPSIGTAAASTLTIDKEIEYGDAYMQMLRASQPIVNDPLLSAYVTQLGAKLLAQSDDVKTPFHFFLIENKELNAFAFFGGNIALHTGLFLHAQNESELASVVAHEIAHLTQRHLARAMEDQSKKTPLTMAALIGSLMLGIASPQAGIAAVQATSAASTQDRINYTRSNEKEADRIGIENLNRAGFDVQSMPTFFSRLSDQYRFSSKPPAFLLTHPLPDDRITDSRLRADQYSKKSVSSSEEFELARVRIVARHLRFSSQQSLDWFHHATKKATTAQIKAFNYGKALVYIDSRKFNEAQALLTPLYKAAPHNRFYLDAMTDLDLAMKRNTQALNRLERELELQPNNQVLLINYLYAQVKSEKYKDAISGLQKYTHKYPTDINGWNLLHQAYDKSNNVHGSLSARGEIFVLKGLWQKAIKSFYEASKVAKLGSLDQARYDARIDQLRIQQMRAEALKR